MASTDKANTSIKAAKSHTFIDFEGKLCKIIVGVENCADSVAFNAHEDVLRERSKYFEAALSKSWQENKEGILRVPDASADTVRRYLEHAYRRHLITSDAPVDASTRPDDTEIDKEYLLLARLYVFGEYVQDRAFKVATIQRLLSRMCDCDYDDETHGFLDGRVVRIIYDGTTTGSPMRRLVVAAYVGEGSAAWIMQDMDGIPKEFLMDLSLAFFRDERTMMNKSSFKELREVYVASEQ